MAPEHRPQLDGLRLVAFAGVFVYHIQPAFAYGALGVQLFFVLSGFLITRILVLCEGPSIARTLRAFYARRALRIFPIYYGTLLFCRTFLYLEGAKWQYLFLTNFYVFKFGRFPRYIAHFWTLGVEEQFYLTFPLALYAAPKRHRFAAVVALFIACKAATIATYYAVGPRIYLDCLPIYAAAPLLIGCLAGLWEIRRGGRPWYIWLGIALFAAHSVLRLPPLPWPAEVIYRDVQYVAFALLVLGLWSSSGWLARALAFKPAAYLGKISYGLYVYHVPVIDWARTIAGDAPFPLGVVALAGTIAVSILSWHLFESPILALKRWFPYDRSPGVGAEVAAEEPRDALAGRDVHQVERELEAPRRVAVVRPELE
jgi:peptidoglycan/LPS O-acetylase OafA/YrhL